MTVGVEESRATAFRKAAIPLLKEYAGKLLELRKRMRHLRRAASSARNGRSLEHEDYQETEREYEALKSYYFGLQPAVINLSQAVSQYIEHADLEDLERIELRLRLAELEAAWRAIGPYASAQVG
jgi:hypothetical protein